jgi:hypothetical protein
MKSFFKLFLLVSGLVPAAVHAGALHVSNSKGFDSNPLVDSNGTILTEVDPVRVAIGTFASEPATALPGSELGIDSATYATLLAGFTAYGAPVGLEATIPPISRRGTFVFQDNLAVAGSPLVDKPVYLLIAKGADFATATEIAILRTTASFTAADDINPVPKLVGVGTGLGSGVIVGSASRFTAAPTGLSSTPRPAYSLAAILPPTEIVVEQPAGSELVDGAATIDFGPVALGSHSEQTFRIRNTGDSNLDLMGPPAIVTPGSAAAQFTVIAPPATPVLPGGETFFTVRFTATIAGNASATLQIASNDADENPFDILLTGNTLDPEIVVEQPEDTDIPDGGTKGFGTVLVGGTVDLVFTVKNIGYGDLTPVNLSEDGADFAIVTNPTAPVAGSGGMTSFTIRFAPATPGAKSAALQIASNDADENPFDITLTGQALSANDDTDGDGLNDAAEFQMAALGYDWQISQPALVGTLFTHSNLAGLYTQAQVHALHAGTPLITRNPATGRFALTMDWQKSWDLLNFADFPAQPADVSVDPAGDIRFEFTSPDDAAFFRVDVK